MLIITNKESFKPYYDSMVETFIKFMNSSSDLTNRSIKIAMQIIEKIASDISLDQFDSMLHTRIKSTVLSVPNESSMKKEIAFLLIGFLAPKYCEPMCTHFHAEIWEAVKNASRNVAKDGDSDGTKTIKATAVYACLQLLKYTQDIDTHYRSIDDIVKDETNFASVFISNQMVLDVLIELRRKLAEGTDVQILFIAGASVKFGGTLPTLVSSFLEMVETALETLSAMARSAGHRFAPYGHQCTEDIIRLLERTKIPSIREKSILAIAEITISKYESVHWFGSESASGRIVLKLVEFLEKEENIMVAITIFETFLKLLRRIEPNAIDNEDVVKKLFTCVKRVIAKELKCQHSPDRTAENSLVELAGKMLSLLGKATHPCKFSQHVSALLPTIQNQFHSATNDDYGQYVRGLVYEELNRCCKRLREYTSKWFQPLFDIFIFGLERKNKHAICGLGTLMYYAGEQHAIDNYPFVLRSLNAIRNRSAVSKAVHIAIAKMVIANPALVALNRIMPFLIEKLMKKRKAMTWVCKAVLYVTEKHADDVEPILERIIRCVAGVYERGKFENEGR